MRLCLSTSGTIGLAAMLAACGGGSGGGGGGGGGLGSTPTPPPTPTPSPSGNAALLPAPPTAPLASFSVGAIGPIFENVSDGQPQTSGPATVTIRYDAATSSYQVAGFGDPAYLPLLADGNGGITTTYPGGYQQPSYYRHDPDIGQISYSGVLGYNANDNDFGFTSVSGVVAYGVPFSSVPTTGSASYFGRLYGRSSVPVDDGWGYVYSGWVEGTMQLNADFASSTLSGLVAPSVQGTNGVPVSLGLFSLGNFSYASGQSSFSGGILGTPAGGQNFFDGVFTGPNAAEAIGRFAFPFALQGTDYQAAGVWISKR